MLIGFCLGLLAGLLVAVIYRVRNTTSGILRVLNADDQHYYFLELEDEADRTITEHKYIVLHIDARYTRK